MKFNDDAQLDTSQVQDRRGSSGSGGGGGFSLGKGGLAGGGVGVVAIIVFVLFQVFSGSGGSSTGSPGVGGLLSQLAGGSTPNAQADSKNLVCTGGATSSDDCEVLAIVNSVQSFWSQQLATSGTTYTESDTVFFSGSTSTGCGTGETGMGPFYCPADKQVYIDLSFWSELKTTFNANDALFTQAYVLAHEYGHHVQDLLGTSARISTAAGATSGSVRLELQADCYAGVWANHASTVAGSDGKVLISDITSQDVANALDTAGKIGDDYIQTTLGSGTVDASTFTHGSSAQRRKWFTTGYQTGKPTACNTFDTNSLG
ncbi:putative metalloprotease [Nakamurella sp. UYEF19]|uniref:KPN_02809 family neutral zinc metallopeptidase n=1 Tax=Nakamurella sp. UYEF19 TaxID=1756392 RepID=UPI003395B367